jgi:hypothetical protein
MGGSNSGKAAPFAGDMVLFDVSSAGCVLGRNYPLSLSTEERSRHEPGTNGAESPCLIRRQVRGSTGGGSMMAMHRVLLSP